MTLAEVEAVVPRFTGAIEQVPPAVSAIKVDGQRAYDRASKGEAVAMKARGVTIHSLQILPTCGEVAARSADGGGWRPEASVDAAPPLHHPSGGPPPRTGEELESIPPTARSAARRVGKEGVSTVGSR